MALVLTTVLGYAAPLAAAERWVAETSSRPARAHGDALYARCGERDHGLDDLAGRLLARQLAGDAPLDAPELASLARQAGVPQPEPRALLLAGEAAASPEEAIARWAHGAEPSRCGIARGAAADGKPLLAVASVPVLAELAPVPRRVEVGRWVALDGVVAAGIGDAHVVVLAPRGAPRRVLSSLSSDGRLLSRFVVDSPGRWLVQVLGDRAGGPRPIAEVELFAGVEPAAEEPSTLASVPQHEGGLLRLLGAARAEACAPRLRREDALDRIARAHAEAMAAAGRIAHDLGAGDPAERVAAAGFAARQVGENVAAAPTIERAHAVLWRSPSHRQNMLDASFTRVGVATARDERGRFWVVQLYAD